MREVEKAHFMEKGTERGRERAREWVREGEREEGV